MAQWRDTGSAYARSFEMLTAGAAPALIDAVAASVPTGSLLDIGSGTGVLVTEARARGFRVTAAEPEASMRRVLNERFPDLCVDADALPRLRYPDGTFDAVTTGFVLNHVPSPRAAVRELLRVTRLGGVVGATIWPTGASPLRPVWEHMAAVVEAPLGAPLPAEADFPRTADGLATVFADAGAAEVVTSLPSWVWHVAPARLWEAVEGGIASIGSVYRGADDEQRRRMRAAFDAATAELTSASGVLELPHTAVLAVARR